MSKFDSLIKEEHPLKQPSGAIYMRDYQDIKDGRWGPQSIYKYIDMESFIKCILNNNIRFVQPTEWPDKYEQHFYTANYKNITKNQDLTPKFWACCFTTNKISEASWKVYTHGKQGLGIRCVKLRLNRKKMRESIMKDDSIKNLYEGFINYSLSDYEIQHLHCRKANGHKEFFRGGFSLKKYLSLMFIKRDAFKYEEEFRYMITKDKNVADHKTIKEIFVHIDWPYVIEGIEVDSGCGQDEIIFLEDNLKKTNIGVNILKSKLYEDPIEKPITIQK